MGRGEGERELCIFVDRFCVVVSSVCCAEPCSTGVNLFIATCYMHSVRVGMHNTISTYCDCVTVHL